MSKLCFIVLLKCIVGVSGIAVGVGAETEGGKRGAQDLIVGHLFVKETEIETGEQEGTPGSSWCAFIRAVRAHKPKSGGSCSHQLSSLVPHACVNIHYYFPIIGTPFCWSWILLFCVQFRFRVLKTIMAHKWTECKCKQRAREISCYFVGLIGGKSRETVALIGSESRETVASIDVESRQPQ